MVIEPTVGRVVWYRERNSDETSWARQPYAAIVTYVHSMHLVDLVVFYNDSKMMPVCIKRSVVLEQDDVDTPNGPYAEWMPYQKGQAAKTEALEARVKAESPQAVTSDGKPWAP